MRRRDSKREESLLEELSKQIALDKARYHDRSDEWANREKFQYKVNVAMRRVPGSLPWLLRLQLKAYGQAASIFEWFVKLVRSTKEESSSQTETLARLKFAAEYGCYANEQQRTFIQLHCEALNQMAATDISHLIWTNNLSLKREQFRYGHWDWIAGLVIMCLTTLFFVGETCYYVSLQRSDAMKLAVVIFHIVTGIVTLSVCKAQTFDVFRIGRKYFHPNGWSYRPLRQSL